MPEFEPTMPAAILHTLAKLGASANGAIPFLVEEYTNETNAFRYVAAVVRNQIDDATSTVLPILFDGLRKPDFATRFIIADALCRMNSAALPGIVETLKDGDARIRRKLTRALPKMTLQATAIVELLEQQLDDSNIEVRLAAIDALAEMGPSAAGAVSKLAGLRNDPESMIRLRSAETLKRIQIHAPGKR